MSTNMFCETSLFLSIMRTIRLRGTFGALFNMSERFLFLLQRVLLLNKSVF